MQSRQGAPRVIRGFSAALAATFTALLGHVAGGGAVPDALALAAPLGLSMLASVLLQSRKLSVVRLSLAVAASQALFHVLFVMGSGGEIHMHGTALAGDVLMWGSHAFAAFATVVFLVRGEQAIHRVRDAAWRLAAWLRVRLADLAIVPALPARVRVQSDTHRSWLLLTQLRGSAHPHRGPPSSS